MNLIAILRNIAYSFGANLFSFCVSIFMVLFVPKFLSVDDYGLWQLFLFYFSYLGFLHFGWEDGIYLRYAGKNFEELDPKTFSGQFYGIVLLQIVLAGIVTGFCWIFMTDTVKQTALLCAVWLAPMVNFNTLCNFIMQITNQIKDYARFMLTERVAFFLGVVILLLVFNLDEFRYMYYAKIFSMLATTCIGIYLCRRLIRPKFYPIKDILKETKQNLDVGSKLLVANIASLLIIGVIRYGISIGWDVATFGRVSLTFGISNFLIVFITSVSVVFFPIIKKMDETKRTSVYIKIRGLLSIILFAVLIGYYPLKCLLEWWLPKYADSLIYMSILFPVCVFAGKISILINTYLKSMRHELLMLKINCVSVIVSVITTFFVVEVLHDLDLTVFSIVAIYAFQCCLAEVVIGHLLELNLRRDILEDLVMCGIFIASGWIFHNILCMVIYVVAYAMFILMHREQVRNLFVLFKDRLGISL